MDCTILPRRLGRSRRLALVACALPFCFVPAGRLLAEGEATPPRIEESIQVTATRIAEDVDIVPVSITVLSAEELRERGATDLESALALVGGISISPGGDGGPGSAVPEMWGLREADAYLLVVDGVPRGGAFNPDLATLDLTGVERIEVLRGAAPVMYGATSFIGVIHVIHFAAGDGERRGRLAFGNYSSGQAAIELPLQNLGNWRQSLSASVATRGYRDDHTGWDRGVLLYRGATEAAGGLFRLDFSAAKIDQDPASPHPREGRVLSARVPLDANHNPDGARLDEQRFELTFGFDKKVGSGDWSTVLSLAHSQFDILRGFLGESLTGNLNARGYTQDREVDDLYFDTHFAIAPSEKTRFVFGIDHLQGKGEAEGVNFAYTVGLDGAGGSGRSLLETIEFEDERAFSGLYAQGTFSPSTKLRFELGLRLNRTDEDREGEADPIGEVPRPGEEEGGADSLDATRGSGFVGVSYQLLDAEPNRLWVFANYRKTFKPAAIDFGPEAEAEILEPETGESWEAGFKGELFGGRLHGQLTAFQMDLENLVVPQSVNGLPALVNAGAVRLEGYELEAEVELAENLDWEIAASHHDSRFGDYLQLFGSTPTQLRGKRFEMSPQELYATALFYRPAHGLFASVLWQYVGDRYLNKRNTALAEGYDLLSASLGWRFAHYEVRLDGRNLGDERPAVAESELGDAQYYRLPARSWEIGLRFTF